MTHRTLNRIIKPNFWKSVPILVALAGVLLPLIATKGQTVYWLPANSVGFFPEPTGNVLRARVDGTHRQTILYSARPEHVVIDAAEGYAYWAEGERQNEEPSGRIRRARLDGTDVFILLRANMVFDGPLAIDSMARRMYWVAEEFARWQIRGANLDGSGHTPIGYALGGLDSRILSLAVDPLGPALYWVEDDPPGIVTSGVDGSDPHYVLMPEGGPVGAIREVVVDSFSGKLYWRTRSAIYRANPDGTKIEVIHAQESATLDSMVIDPMGGHLYWVDTQGGAGLYRMETGGGIAEFVGDLQTPPPGKLDLDPNLGRLFWGSGTALNRLDVEKPETRVVFGATLYPTHALAFDWESEALFAAAESHFDFIRNYFIGWFGRMSLSTFHVEGTSLHGPTITSLAYEPTRSELLGTSVTRVGIFSETACRVFQMKNGTRTDLLERLYSNDLYFWGINVDGFSDQMFWIGDGVMKANIDGSSVASIVPGEPLWLAIDRIGQKVYWSGLFVPGVRRANYDGTNVEVLFKTSGAPIAIDDKRGKLYRVASGELRRSNLDGSDDEVLFPIGRTYFLAIDPRAPGDANDDGRVDLKEFARLQNCFRGDDANPPAGCAFYDADRGDRDVDLADYALFRAVWTGP